MSQTMRQKVEHYLDCRRKHGYRMKTEGYLLLKFADYADLSGHRGPLTVDLALRWACLPVHSSKLYQARRLEVVRCFAKYQASVERGTQIPPGALLGQAHRRVQPYVYSRDEVVQLMKAAQNLHPKDGLRRQTVATVLGLLACCGMRPFEAVSLECDDVDLESGVVTIRQGKFRKSRLMPLDPSAVRKLSDYAQLRRRLVPKTPSQAFFLTESGRPFTYRMLSEAFKSLRLCLGSTAGRRRPRLYDLRHHFACERILAWYREGTDVDCKIGALSTYMGHVKVSDTYWYISAIPQLLEAAVHRFETFAARRDGCRP